MPGARVLVTARPGEIIEQHVFDRRVEMYGFDEPRLDQYVSMFCAGNDTKNGNLESNIRSYIDNDNNVGRLCYVPELCKLFCYTVKKTLEQHGRVSSSTTITHLLTMSVVYFVTAYHPDYNRGQLSEENNPITHLKDLLLSYSSLAKEGMNHLPVKVLFLGEDLKRWGLSRFIAR